MPLCKQLCYLLEFVHALRLKATANKVPTTGLSSNPMRTRSQGGVENITMEAPKRAAYFVVVNGAGKLNVCDKMHLSKATQLQAQHVETKTILPL